MSQTERESLHREAVRIAGEAQAEGGNPRNRLAPLFRRALHDYPDEEDRLLELWDRLTNRPVV